MSDIEARGYRGDRKVHLYPATEFISSDTVVMPLHVDGDLHPDYHERRAVGAPIGDLAEVDICQPCVAVARRLAHQALAVQPSWPPTGRHPEQDGPTAPAGAMNPQPAGAPGAQR